MKELELLSLEGLSSFLKRNHKPFTLKPGQTCLNCDSLLTGRFCATCGQNATQHHRHIFHMMWEAIEGLFHLDGRLWRTLPPLMLRPGLLARDYIEGRLARHVPPFRTFLVALLVFIFASEQVTHHFTKESEERVAEAQHSLKDPAKLKIAADRAMKTAARDLKETRADAAENRKDRLEDVTDTAKKAAIEARYQNDLIKAQAEYDAVIKDPEAAGRKRIFQEAHQGFDLFAPDENGESRHIHVKSFDSAQGKLLNENLQKAIKSPAAFILTLFGWGHGLTVLLLPIMTTILGLLYVYKRRFYLFDHFLVSCNILSFSFILAALIFALPQSIWGWGFLILLIWSPVNMFMTLRGAYGSSIIGAFLKTWFLWWATVISFLMLLGLIFYVSLLTL